MHSARKSLRTRAGQLRPVAFSLFALATGQLAFGQAASPAADDKTNPPAQTPVEKTDGKKTDDSVVVLETLKVNAGFASSLAAAAEAKQNNASLVEVIMPEDIGKLPDVSIADSLTRLTGLTSQRVNGRNQQVTIRGFSPDFSIGTLDGVEQATTNDNRAVEYDQYPSELVGGVVVYKTGQANLVGGLAGTVDLLTTSPLSVSGRVIAASAFYNWTAYSQLTPGVKKAGESYTASYIDHFAHDTEGIFIGFSHTENPYQGKQWSAWGYPTAPDGNLVLGGSRVFAQSELLKRDALVAVLESKPNSNIHSKIDLLYSKFDENKLLGGMQIPMAEWSGAQLQPGYTVTNGLITNYTLTNVNPVLEQLVTHWKDHIESAIWNLDLAQNSDWPVKFQTGWSLAKRNEEVLETYAGLGFNNTETNPATLIVTQNAGPTPAQAMSNTNFGDRSLFTITDPQGWGVGTLPTTGQEGYLKYFAEQDIADSAKLSTTHDLNWTIFKSVEGGISYSERYKYAAQNPTGYLVNSNGQPQAALPPSTGTTNLSYAGNLQAIGWSAQGLLDTGALSLLQNPNPGTFVGDDFKVWEEITRPYVQFGLKGHLGSVPFDGNLGVSADLTQQRSTGLSAGGGTLVTPVSASASYANLLPALNLIFKPSDKDVIRFSVGRQSQRPRMYDMRASRDYSYNATLANSTTLSPWSGSSGNPNLRPWLADSIDLGYEHYFGHGGGYFSLALFQKKLLSYIYQENVLTDFTGYNYTSVTAPLLKEGYTSTNVNGQGGNVRGLEATLQITSDSLTGGSIKGFGVVLNGLLVDSNIQPWGPTQPSAPLPNLSKKSGNVTLYYEAHGFAARVSMHYQSETREYIENLGVPNPASYGTPGDGYATETPFHTIDAQISYSFYSGPLKGLGLYLEGRNLNDAALIQYNNGDTRQLSNWQKYGASYRAGASYKF
jgi:iron complex outermembrane receptor protein